MRTATFRRRVMHTALGVAGACLLGGLVLAQSATVTDAARRGDREAVRALLKSGADVNAAEGDGTTALHWAARSGDGELVQMLVSAGANVRATTRLGAYTPLMMAAQFAPPLATKLLLEEGADPHLRNNLDRSALDLAQMRDNPQAAFYIRAFIEAWEVNERAQQEGAASQ